MYPSENPELCENGKTSEKCQSCEPSKQVNQFMWFMWLFYFSINIFSIFPIPSEKPLWQVGLTKPYVVAC